MPIQLPGIGGFGGSDGGGRDYGPEIASLRSQLARLQSTVNNLDRVLSNVQATLDEYRPTLLNVRDLNGLPRRYEVLATNGGSYTDLTTGTPFEIKDVGTEDQENVTIFYSSSLLNSLVANDRQIIQGLDDGTGANGFPVKKNDIVWLEGDVTSLENTSVKVQWGNQWTGYPQPIAFVTGDDGTQQQTKWFLALGQIIAAIADDFIDNPGPPLTGPNNLMVAQYVFENLVMRNICWNGNPAIYPFPFGAAVQDANPS